MHSPSTDDVRIAGVRQLLRPEDLMLDVAVGDKQLDLIRSSRDEIGRILHGTDDRTLVVTGPCSIHDPNAAIDYAERLKKSAERYADDLLIVMRTYFEKPRTTIGWKGLINDPRLDDSFDINHGLRIARGLLRDIAMLGLPSGTEFLDPISPQWLADLVSWGAIGARTTESQVHRELASGLSMPVGFKNGTRGTISVAIDAVNAAKHPHHFLSITKQGVAAIIETKGNDVCHLILRGGSNAPNYDAASVDSAVEQLKVAGLAPRLMVDCSHANSNKDHRKQPAVAEALAAQIETGNGHIFGVMLESFLEGGRQNAAPGDKLAYGQSITDACMSWDMTTPVLERLAVATNVARKRR